MEEVVKTLVSEENLFFVVGGAIAITAIICTSVGRTIRASARERSRREIAAYIAEGSMTPEQGERLMSAGKGKPDGCC